MANTKSKAASRPVQRPVQRPAPKPVPSRPAASRPAPAKTIRVGVAPHSKSMANGQPRPKKRS